MENNLCRICNSEKEKLFTKKILGKYEAAYYQCPVCGFLQTEEPYWLKEAYLHAITPPDVGLVNRNIEFSNITEEIIYKYFDKKGRFLDFAGGYGMFTRIMRDKGFDFYHEDKYCENLFAKYFSIDDLPQEDRRFELITSFELMEHIENPFKELDYIFSMTDSFLFSTELIPAKDIENWQYLGTEHGQHISFYTRECLKRIAGKYNKKYYSDGYLHLITNKRNLKIFEKVSRVVRLSKEILNEINPPQKMPSKTQEDFEYVKKIIGKL